MSKYESIEKFLIHFIQDEVRKAGLSKVVLGISGGVDSAVVAILAQKAFGSSSFLGLFLPSSTSSPNSLKDAQSLCEKFNIKTEKAPIGNLVDTYFKDKEATKLRIGNFSARMRMATLYDISARENALVLGTSNKSEILLGYGTIFGDIACAINPIGELYKTEIFEFAAYLGVPESILSKAPSADLWEGQSDEDEMGFTYAQIDKVLIAHSENKLSPTELVANGFDKGLVEMIMQRIEANRFKGKLPTIANLATVK
ncbi:MAG: NAD+ synthase [Sulfurospirillaceae bacterium]|nr:NAD+ synthase [Sulfurospirillaceae bacterium]MDD2825907.1 NAD+ synthase [Sulfurospirillaceae bacterium]